MRTSSTRAGFSLIEMLVASLLLGMLVTILSTIFTQSAVAWRTGAASVSGLAKARLRLSSYQFAADNWLPRLEGESDSAGGFVQAVWLKGSDLIDSEGESLSIARGFSKSFSGRYQTGDKCYLANIDPNTDISFGSLKTYIVGVGSAGPDRRWNTADDIATWPNEVGGGF